MGSVTTIGESAFYNCTRLKSISISGSVTSIGDSAFAGCNSLKSIDISGSVTSIGKYAFSFCSSLTDITIPEGVTTIGDNAFRACYSLAGITILGSVNKIGEDAFFYTAYYDNTNNWENGVLYIGNHLIEAETSISGAYTVKSGTITIAENAFYECSSLTAISIPSSVTSIGKCTFYDCSDLTSVSIPDSVTEIGYKAFGDCSSLTSISIPNSVTSIGERAFSGCSKLKSISIPSSVTSIGSAAFSGCSKLTSISIPSSVTSIANSVFFDCSRLTDITIPDSVTSIGDYAFFYCSRLTDIAIPDSVASIGEWAFDGCYNLEDVWYTGSRADKAAIHIAEYNTNLIGATWHYNCDLVADHVYVGACDADCNICGTTRVAAAHVYAGVCDTDCNVCSATRVAAAHVYTVVCDADCNTCGAIRTVTHSFGEYVYNNDATEKKDGTKTRICSVCQTKETVTAEGTKLQKTLLDSSELFTDVSPKAWYKSYIDYAVTYGLLSGTGGGTMAPEKVMTRAEFVQVLANLSGIDTSNRKVNAGFADVASGKWYAPAIKWASENSIVTGTGDGNFSPGATVTREQMCTMLIRYIENYCGITLKQKTTKKIFADDANISSWAKKAVYKCQMSELVSGVSATEFAPQNVANRAAVATIMTRFHKQCIR